VDRAAGCRARAVAEAAAVPMVLPAVVEQLVAVVCLTWAHPEAAPRTKASSKVRAAVVERRAQPALLAARWEVLPVARKVACQAVPREEPQVARPALVECRVEVPRAVVVP